MLHGLLDILINKAGFQHINLIEDFPTERVEMIIKVMLTTPFITTKLAFPLIKKQRYGRVINMSSINGLIGLQERLLMTLPGMGLSGLPHLLG